MWHFLRTSRNLPIVSVSCTPSSLWKSKAQIRPMLFPFPAVMDLIIVRRLQTVRKPLELVAMSIGWLHIWDNSMRLGCFQVSRRELSSTKNHLVVAPPGFVLFISFDSPTWGNVKSPMWRHSPAAGVAAVSPSPLSSKEFVRDQH